MADFTPVSSEIRYHQKVRSFDAYLEILPSVMELPNFTPTMPGDEVDMIPGSDMSKLFPVIGFRIEDHMGQLPRATVSLPVGGYVTNLSGRFGEAEW